VTLQQPIRGWKKLAHEALAELEIPEGALVQSVTGHKWRASKAKVLSITGMDDKSLHTAASRHSGSFHYTVGKIVKPHTRFDLTPKECSTGIHFFMKREEAEAY
jgi:hypothetical protein